MINSRACVQGPAGHEVDTSRGQNPAQLLTTRSPGSLGLRLPRPEKQNPKQRHTAQDTLGISFHTLILALSAVILSPQVSVAHPKPGTLLSPYLTHQHILSAFPSQ